MRGESSDEVRMIDDGSASPVVRFREPPVARHPASWMTDDESRQYVFKLFTCFYAMIMIIIGALVELSDLVFHSDSEGTELHDLILALYMFCGSIAFILYCGFMVFRQHQLVLAKRRSLCIMNNRAKENNVPEMLSNKSTGSLYLRIGCILFGLIGIIFYLLQVLICYVKDRKCNNYGTVIFIFAALFMFVQMWFVFCNGKVKFANKISFVGSVNVARLGLMHLVATNVWMWIKYVLKEEAETITEITDSHHHHHHHHGTNGTENNETCVGMKCVVGEWNEFMFTCVVEYSLICAGVAFVFWTSIGSVSRGEPDPKMKKRSIIKVDCSRTTEGLFGGFIFIIVTALSIILFQSTDDTVSQIIFLSTNIAFFVIAIGACLTAFFTMRILRFEHEHEEPDASAELLDQILLVVGLLGELLYCIGGIVAFTQKAEGGSTRQEKGVFAWLLLTVHSLRLVQVSLQSALLMVSARLVLNTDDPKIMRYKPGKQVITLLLMVNVALFLLNIFEATKAGLAKRIIDLYGQPNWAVIVRGCAPLTIFYRFHSSACFAEVWKKTYKRLRPRETHA